MKKRKYLLILVGVVVGLVALGATNWKGISPARDGVSKYTTTFANSQRDTLTFRRDDAIAGLAFGLHIKDTMSISEIYVRRIIGGEFTSDSTRLSGAITNTGTTPGYQGTQANPSYSSTYTVVLAPLCDTYVFIVVYAASANGVTNPAVDYFVNVQNYER